MSPSDKIQRETRSDLWAGVQDLFSDLSQNLEAKDPYVPLEVVGKTLEAASILPGLPQPTLRIGGIFLSSAAEFLRAMPSQDPLSKAERRLDEADSSFQQGQHQVAAKEYRSVLSELDRLTFYGNFDPKISKTFGLKARAHHGLGEYKEALDALYTAKSSQPVEAGKYLRRYQGELRTLAEALGQQAAQAKASEDIVAEADALREAIKIHEALGEVEQVSAYSAILNPIAEQADHTALERQIRQAAEAKLFTPETMEKFDATLLPNQTGEDRGSMLAPFILLTAKEEGGYELGFTKDFETLAPAYQLRVLRSAAEALEQFPDALAASKIRITAETDLSALEQEIREAAQESSFSPDTVKRFEAALDSHPSSGEDQGSKLNSFILLTPKAEGGYELSFTPEFEALSDSHRLRVLKSAATALSQFPDPKANLRRLIATDPDSFKRNYYQSQIDLMEGNFDAAKVHLIQFRAATEGSEDKELNKMRKEAGKLLGEWTADHLEQLKVFNEELKNQRLSQMTDKENYWFVDRFQIERTAQNNEKLIKALKARVITGKAHSLDEALAQLRESDLGMWGYYQNLSEQDADFALLLERETQSSLEKRQTDEGRRQALLEEGQQLRHSNGSYSIAGQMLEGAMAEEWRRAREEIPAERMTAIREDAHNGYTEYKIKEGLKEQHAKMREEDPEAFERKFGADGVSEEELAADFKATQKALIEAEMLQETYKVLETKFQNSEISDPIARQAWEAYEDMNDPLDKWWWDNISDQSRDAIIDEAVVMAATLPATMGVGSVVRGTLSSTRLAAQLVKRGHGVAVKLGIFASGSVVEGFTQEALTMPFAGSYELSRAGYNVVMMGAFHGGGRLAGRYSQSLGVGLRSQRRSQLLARITSANGKKLTAFSHRLAVAGKKTADLSVQMTTQTTLGTAASLAEEKVHALKSEQDILDHVGATFLRMLGGHLAIKGINKASGDFFINFEKNGMRRLARGVEEFTSHQSADNPFTQHRAERTLPDIMHRAKKVFGLTEAELKNPAAVKSKYRQLTRQFHPDQGGSHEDMIELQVLRAILLRDVCKLEVSAAESALADDFLAGKIRVQSRAPEAKPANVPPPPSKTEPARPTTAEPRRSSVEVRDVDAEVVPGSVKGEGPLHLVPVTEEAALKNREIYEFVDIEGVFMVLEAANDGGNVRKLFRPIDGDPTDFTLGEKFQLLPAVAGGSGSPRTFASTEEAKYQERKRSMVDREWSREELRAEERELDEMGYHEDAEAIAIVGSRHEALAEAEGLSHAEIVERMEAYYQDAADQMAAMAANPRLEGYDRREAFRSRAAADALNELLSYSKEDFEDQLAEFNSQLTNYDQASALKRQGKELTPEQQAVLADPALRALEQERLQLVKENYPFHSLVSADTTGSPIRSHLEAHLSEGELGSSIGLGPDRVFADASAVIQFAEGQLQAAYRGELKPGTEIPLTLKTADGSVAQAKLRCMESGEKADGVEVGGSSAGGRVVLRLEFDRAIGKEGIAEIQPGEQVETVERTSGGRSETVQVVNGEKPDTRVLYIIGGAYGPTGKFGLYTLFSGRFAPPMNDTAFWTRHAFLRATPQGGPKKVSEKSPESSSPEIQEKINLLREGSIIEGEGIAQEIHSLLENPHTKEALEGGLQTAAGNLTKKDKSGNPTPDPIAAYNALHAAILEARTTLASIEMGGVLGTLPPEQLQFEWKEPDPKNPKKSIKRKVQNDVPVFEGRIWELKRYPRMEYGTKNQPQALNYQNLISGKVPGSPFRTATIQVAGNVHPEMIPWMKEHTPDVEVLYTLPLPSGQNYVFALKPGSKDQPGLAERFPQPKDLSEREQKIIAGVQRALAEQTVDGKTIREIDSILRSTLLGFDPFEIKSLEDFKKFEKDILEKRWELLEKLGEAQVIEAGNTPERRILQPEEYLPSIRYENRIHRNGLMEIYALDGDPGHLLFLLEGSEWNGRKMEVRKKEFDYSYVQETLDHYDRVSHLTYRGRSLAPRIDGILSDGEGRPVGYAMEKVPGENLHDLIKAGKVSPEQMEAIEGLLEEQLDILHKEGLAHGDAEFRNVLVQIGEGGEVLDARFIDFTRPMPDKTVPHHGTPEYDWEVLGADIHEYWAKRDVSGSEGGSSPFGMPFMIFSPEAPLMRGIDWLVGKFTGGHSILSKKPKALPEGKKYLPWEGVEVEANPSRHRREPFIKIRESGDGQYYGITYFSTTRKALNPVPARLLEAVYVRGDYRNQDEVRLSFGVWDKVGDYVRGVSQGKPPPRKKIFTLSVEKARKLGFEFDLSGKLIKVRGYDWLLDAPDSGPRGGGGRSGDPSSHNAAGNMMAGAAEAAGVDPVAFAQAVQKYQAGLKSPERKAFQKDIAEKLAEQGESSDKPTIIFMAGPVGAGKSTAIAALDAADYLEMGAFAMIDPDAVKEMIPEYPIFKGLDISQAATAVQSESAGISNLARDKALKKRKNIIIDGTMKNAENSASLIRRIKKKYPEYNVAIIHVKAPKDVLLERVADRARKTGRVVPDKVVVDSQSLVQRSIAQLKDLADVTIEIDNQSRPVITSYYKNGRSTAVELPLPLPHETRSNLIDLFASAAESEIKLSLQGKAAKPHVDTKVESLKTPDEQPIRDAARADMPLVSVNPEPVEVLGLFKESTNVTLLEASQYNVEFYEAKSMAAQLQAISEALVGDFTVDIPDNRYYPITERFAYLVYSEARKAFAKEDPHYISYEVSIRGSRLANKWMQKVEKKFSKSKRIVGFRREGREITFTLTGDGPNKEGWIKVRLKVEPIRINALKAVRVYKSFLKHDLPILRKWAREDSLRGEYARKLGIVLGENRFYSTLYKAEKGNQEALTRLSVILDMLNDVPRVIGQHLTEEHRPAMEEVKSFLEGLREDPGLRGRFAEIQENVQGRMKDPEDIAPKMQRRGWRDPAPFTDIAGTRVVVKDPEAAVAIIEEIQKKYPLRDSYDREGAVQLDVAKTEIVDGEEILVLDSVPDRDSLERMIEGNKRGYRAIHLVVEVEGKAVEIQIQTEALHRWGKIQHDTYKNKDNLDPEFFAEVEAYYADAARFLSESERGIIPQFRPQLPTLSESLHEEVRGKLLADFYKMEVLLDEFQGPVSSNPQFVPETAARIEPLPTVRRMGTPAGIISGGDAFEGVSEVVPRDGKAVVLENLLEIRYNVEHNGYEFRKIGAESKGWEHIAPGESIDVSGKTFMFLEVHGVPKDGKSFPAIPDVYRQAVYGMATEGVKRHLQHLQRRGVLVDEIDAHNLSLFFGPDFQSAITSHDGGEQDRRQGGILGGTSKVFAFVDPKSGRIHRFAQRQPRKEEALRRPLWVIEKDPGTGELRWVDREHPHFTEAVDLSGIPPDAILVPMTLDRMTGRISTKSRHPKMKNLQGFFAQVGGATSIALIRYAKGQGRHTVVAKRPRSVPAPVQKIAPLAAGLTFFASPTSLAHAAEISGETLPLLIGAGLWTWAVSALAVGAVCAFSRVGRGPARVNPRVDKPIYPIQEPMARQDMTEIRRPSSIAMILGDNDVQIRRGALENLYPTKNYGSYSAWTEEGIGYGKDVNEDGLVQGPNWAVVLDGMGGMGHGDKASEIAGKKIAEVMGHGGEMIQAFLEGDQAVRAFNDRVTARRRQLDPQALESRAGTVAVAHRIFHEGGLDYAELVSSGDARAAVYEPGLNGFQEVARTEDQSMVGFFRKMGGVKTTLEMRSHPKANVVLGGMGTGSDTPPNRIVVPIRRGTFIIEATDGFWDNVNTAEILEVLNRCSTAREVRDELVKLVRTKMARLKRARELLNNGWGMDAPFPKASKVVQLPDLPGHFIDESGHVYDGKGKMVDHYKADNFTVHVYRHDVPS